MIAPMLRTIDDPAFAQFRRRLTQYHRMHGYYIVDLVSIESLRRDGHSLEELLDRVFEYFDDQDWPPREQRPQDASWSDHEVAASEARELTVKALIGGREIGHTRDSIPFDVAEHFWRDFENFFQEGRRYYVGMGFGDRRYAFLHGVAILDSTRAGVLWIVESD